MPLENFIEDRLSELEKEGGPMRARLAEIDAERRKLLLAKSAIEGGVVFVPNEPHRIGKLASMKEAVVDLLKAHPSGLTANQMLPLVNQKLGTDYTRSSLSPQLSRLKHDGRLVLDGKTWNLRERLL